MSKNCAELNLRSYAKVNLSLDVTGVREDGYHTVETVMQQVSLYDDIRISWEPKKEPGLEIRLSNSKPYLPTDVRNLAYRAAILMAREVNEDRRYESRLSEGKLQEGRQPETELPDSPAGTLKIHIEKRIPVAAGLGGGSGNAAAVMIGLNRLWKLGFDTRRLCRMGEELGADVPFCILVQNSRYTCALGTGIGEILTPIRRGLNKYFVLAKPAFGVSTKEVFREIDNYPAEERPDTDQLVKALRRGDTKKVYNNMANVLEGYTLKKYEEVQRLKEKLTAAGGAGKVLMSGSGPTVMGIYNDYGAARKACLEMRKQGYEAYWVYAGKEIRGEKHVKL